MALTFAPAPVFEPLDSFAIQQWMMSLSQVLSSTTFDEATQDAVGGIFVDTATIDFTYTDATPSITASVKTDSIDNTFLANMAAATAKGQPVGAATTDPVDLTAAQLVTIINTADGAGSLLDADFLDGISSLAFVKADGTVALTADWDAGSFEIRAQTF